MSGIDSARTIYGAVGVKVWIFKGEVLEKKETPVATAPSQTRSATTTVAG